jgi:hypothetical protein
VELLLAFAVRVKAFAEVADDLLLGFGAVRERERVEAAGLYIDGIIAEAETT